MIVGLTGTLCAGKGTVAEILKKDGFQYISLSDMLREDLDRLGIERSRENLIKRANELVEAQGKGVLAKMAAERIDKAQNYVIDGIRRPEEVYAFRDKIPSFFLLGIDAPLELRFQRLQKRPRGEKDPQTIEEFRELNQRDLGKGSDSQNVGDTMRLANVILNNSGDFAALEKAVRHHIKY